MRVLFVCVHNAGRSQMAEGWLRHLAAQRGLPVIASSAGTLGGGTLNPVAVEAMAEIGVPIHEHIPKALTPAMVEEADRIISMGCGVEARSCPANVQLMEDWAIEDPAGRSLECVREIRGQIRQRVERLLDDLTD